MLNPRMCCIDLETGPGGRYKKATGLDWLATILTASISWRNEAGEVATKSWTLGMSDLFNPSTPTPLIRHEIAKIVQQCDLVVGHNLTFDLSLLYRDQLLDPKLVQGKLFDTLLVARMTGAYTSVSLENMAYEYGYFGESWGDMKGNRKKLQKLPPGLVLKYNEDDTETNLRYAEDLYTAARKIYSHEMLVEESDFCDIMARVRLRGQAVDLQECGRIIDIYSTELEKLIKVYLEPNGISGPNQNEEVIAYLRRHHIKLKLNYKSKKPTTDKDVLAYMILTEKEEVSVVLQALLDARERDKRLSTWLVPIYEHHGTLDGRVHANFMVAGAETYRLTASKPGVQAMPKTKHMNIWQPYHSADYSQAELRLGCMISKDSVLAKIFASGTDLHVATAMQMYGIKSAESVAEDQRSRAKTINFASIYRAGIISIAAKAGILIPEARDLLAKHKRTFGGLYTAADLAEKTWLDRGYLTLICGKRAYLQEDEKKQAYAAFNRILQGGVAAICRAAMAKLDKLDYPIIGQTHDEIRFDSGFAGYDREEVIAVMKSVVPEKIQGRTDPIVAMDVDEKLVQIKRTVEITETEKAMWQEA